MKTLRMLIAFTACSCAVWAQADAHRGSISGSIVDPNQAVIPGVKVVASNQNTGLVRETVSNDAGQYRFAALDAGLYTVRATAEGFAEFTARDVVLAVGSSVQLNLNVSLEATVQSIEVGATIIQVQETNSSQIVDQTAIRDLPINGRRFQDFATLSPMVQADSRTRGQLSFAGQRGINSNVMIDGSDYNEPFFGGIRGGERSIFAFTVPQSAIQEFQVVSSGYAPEYGRSTGGILNTVTRSGANDYHGDLFYQLRHKELGLKNPLNQQSLETQHQYGGGIGGPIKRDKLFFFGAFEQQFADFPRLVRFAALDQITNVTPDIAPAYNYYKSLEGPFAQTNDVAAALGRVDYQFDNGSRLTGRYNYSRNEAQNAVTTGTSLNPQTNTALSNNGTEGNNTHTVLGQYTSILSPTTVNDLRVQFSREARPRSSNSEQVNVTTTIGQFGTRNFLPTDANNSRFQIADSLSMQKGRHSLKIGFDYSYIDVFQTFGFNQFGLFSIGGSDVARHLRILSGVSGNRFDDSLVVFRRQIGNLTLGTTAQQLAFFAQDNWRVTDRFTLNYGLRWEGQFNPEPESNNDFLVQNVRNFAYPLGTTDPTKIRDQFDQWAPRVGFAWNPMGDNKTVIRAQTGFYYAQSPVILYAGPLNNFRIPPGDLSLQVNPAGTQTIYQQFRNIGIDFNQGTLDQIPQVAISDVQRVFGADRNPYFGSAVITTSADNYRNPRAFQANFSFDRELFNGFVVDYQLAHVSTVNLQRNTNLNLPAPRVRPNDASQRPFFGLRSGTPRPNPNLGDVTMRDSSARSVFTGNTFRAQYRMRRTQFSLAYTLSYSKSDDDNERNATGFTYANPFDFGREFNWSDLDTRHRVVGYALYQAPFGIELSGLWRWRTGLPMDPVTGGDQSEIISGVNRPMQAPGVMFLRNSFRNRSVGTVDFRFLKSFNVFGEGKRLQFSCEMFNLFNAENMIFSGQSNIYGVGINTDGSPAAIDTRFQQLRNAAGGYNANTTSQDGAPFQAQLGLRFIF